MKTKAIYRLIDKFPAWRMTVNGFEVRSRTSVVADRLVRVPTNLILKPPRGHRFDWVVSPELLTTRGLLFAGDIVGDNGELCLMFFNTTANRVSIPANTLLAHGGISRIGSIEIVEGDKVTQEKEGSTIYDE